MKTKMIEQILKRKNLLQAMRQVQKNHGSAGVDHMPVPKLSELMSIDKEELTVKVRSGKYLPQPILGVEIPKGNGKTRLLGIPTVPTGCFNKQFCKSLMQGLNLNSRNPGVERQQAYAWSRSRKGGWAIAQSPILGTTITVERLKKRGYIPLLELYNQCKPVNLVS
jgi:hypothetical protein